jgi:3-hydroxyisobutyrate dehydrogenase
MNDTVQPLQIAVLGTGLMGRPMALRLLDEGSAVTVWNRTRAKTDNLADAGAAIAESPAQAISGSDVVVLMLTDAAAIRDTLFTEAAQQQLPGRTVIQMGTIAPGESVDLDRELRRLRAQYLEAPVLGSIPEAADGRLIVIVGGDDDLFERWLPVLAVFGPKPRLVGPVGRAAALKLALNQLIATITTGYASSLGMVRRSGVDVATYADIVRHSALFAPTFDKKLPRMLERDFTPANFPVRHLLKDVRLFQDEAALEGLFTPHLVGVASILEKAIELGLGDGDYSGMAAAVDPGNER